MDEGEKDLYALARNRAESPEKKKEDIPMKRLFAILVALVMAMSICSFAAADTEGADLTGKKVGFSALMMSSEFFMDMSNQMQAYFEERGMQYSVADANGDPQTQIQTIENFVQMGMDYIICFVVDRVSISDALIRARQAGAFVIVIGTVLDDKEAADVCISISQYESGVESDEISP